MSKLDNRRENVRFGISERFGISGEKCPYKKMSTGNDLLGLAKIYL